MSEKVTITTTSAGVADAPPAMTNDQSLTALVAGIIKDAQTLMRQELELAKVEIKHELTKTRDAALAMAGGAAALALAGLLLTFMVVHLITWATNGYIPLWGSFGIVGGLFLAGGLVLLFVGKSYADRVRLVPRQTVETMQENVQWIQNPK